MDKLEPSRRRYRPVDAEDRGARGKKGTPTVPVENPLLVILHYLLKNNTQFIGWDGAGQDAPPLGNLLTLSGGWRRE